MNVQTKPAEDAAKIVADLGRRAKTAAAALRTAPVWSALSSRQGREP